VLLRNSTLFLFAFLAGTTFAQDKFLDSLKLALKNAGHDTTRCEILNALAETASDEEWPVFNEQLLKLAEKNAYLHEKGPVRIFYLRHLSAAYNNKGILHDNRGDLQKGLEYYYKSLKIAGEINDKEGVAYTLNNIGFIYRKQGDIPNALEFYHKSLKIRESLGDKQGIEMSLNNIGAINFHVGDLPRALEYYQKSLKISEEIQSLSGIATAYNNIGRTYSLMGEAKTHPDSLSSQKCLFQRALLYYEKSLGLLEKLNARPQLAAALGNIGFILERQGKMNEALDHYYRSLKIREDINDPEGVANANTNIAYTLYKQGKTGEALLHATRGLKLAQQLGYPENIKSAAGVLKLIYVRQNKFREAFQLYELEICMRDSVSNEVTKKATIKKQFQYQYEKKASQDSVKSAEEQKVKNALLDAQQAQLNQEKTQRFALYGGLLLFVGFGGFIFNRFRVSQKQKRIIEKQKEEVDVAYEKLHQKNKEVLDSIYYARRIQRCLLTNERSIAKMLERLKGEINL